MSVAAQFATPTGEAASTTGSAGGLVLLAVVAALALAALDTLTGIDVLGWLPSLGGSLGSSGAASDSDSGIIGSTLAFATSTPMLLLAGVATLLVLILSGAFDLAEGTGLQLVVALELIATFLVLRALGEYRFRLFALTAGATVVISLSALGEPVIGTIVNSNVGPIVAVGTIALLWRLLGGDGGGPQRIVVRGQVEDGDGQ
ncbi:hypothetical protein ACFQL1_15085 [Halomicroarcula sp. GCM10025709]|uniref:hypothetical protein n=1 Tax=Haloarcula TaxID=2237 RepID=UPI0024C405A9|nr:hypothetical protein [Halomicroarcula sp. YJ-61-S]